MDRCLKRTPSLKPLVIAVLCALMCTSPASAVDALGDVAQVRAIVALTADAQASTRQACRAAGMQDVLIKPMTVESLAHMLHGHGRSRRDESAAK